MPDLRKVHVIQPEGLSEVGLAAEKRKYPRHAVLDGVDSCGFVLKKSGEGHDPGGAREERGEPHVSSYRTHPLTLHTDRVR